MRNALYLETEQRWQKRVLSFFFFFQHAGYQNNKTHAKHPIWGNETAFPEMCHFCVSEHISHKKKPIKTLKTHYMGK